ncbi:MAG TPA: phosphoenolpyruvate synthase regulatory protein [Gammaproteobacteria bacterium]|nr:phosphoenolpyruvate synthase regulatory protein [Gammaproteobacteria bacterium]
MMRTIFYLSDSTGLTAETLGRSLVEQFPDLQIREKIIPFISDISSAQAAVKEIQLAAQNDGQPPILFSTLVDNDLRDIIAQSPGILLDFVETFIGRLEVELKMESSNKIGHRHDSESYEKYMARMEALNYALRNDDGSTIQDYDQADIILIGASRTGKTPTCLYLAMHFGILAANYPLTPDDLENTRLPEPLKSHKAKLFGLHITAERLQKIRQERRPNSTYASLSQCQFEVRQTEALFRDQKIPFTTTTDRSVEELASTILHHSKVNRRL